MGSSACRPKSACNQHSCPCELRFHAASVLSAVFNSFPGEALVLPPSLRGCLFTAWNFSSVIQTLRRFCRKWCLLPRNHNRCRARSVCSGMSFLHMVMFRFLAISAPPDGRNLNFDACAPSLRVRRRCAVSLRGGRGYDLSSWKAMFSAQRAVRFVWLPLQQC